MTIANHGRRVGLLYLLLSIPGFFALLYVPGKLIVRDNPTATVNNIAASHTLFRAGITCNVLSNILFLWVAIALFDLFKNVNRRHALAMVGLFVISVPIALFNELNSIAALTLIQGAGFLTSFDQLHRNDLAMLFLNLHTQGYFIASIFWGLWLFPMGLLAYHSRFLPRFLGILLMLNCLSYVVSSTTALLLPQFRHIVDRCMMPLSFGELIFMLWLIIMGTTPRRT